MESADLRSKHKRVARVRDRPVNLSCQSASARLPPSRAPRRWNGRRVQYGSRGPGHATRPSRLCHCSSRRSTTLLESASVSATDLSPDAVLTAMYADVRPRICAGGRSLELRISGNGCPIFRVNLFAQALAEISNVLRDPLRNRDSPVESRKAEAVRSPSSLFSPSLCLSFSRGLWLKKLERKRHGNREKEHSFGQTSLEFLYSTFTRPRIFLGIPPVSISRLCLCVPNEISGFLAIRNVARLYTTEIKRSSGRGV